CILLSIMDVMRISDLYQNKEINCCIMLIFIVFYIALIGLMLCSLIAIYKASSLKKTFMDHEKYYTNGYLSIAKELDVLSEEQVKEAAKQLAPERTIDFREYI
ncbi:MAG: hypothetical protein LUB63_05985, partial [Oscillospiraceae bacterium]|nr:hypothetical protein [Oscillospiraceae bacterium]